MQFTRLPPRSRSLSRSLGDYGCQSERARPSNLLTRPGSKSPAFEPGLSSTRRPLARNAPAPWGEAATAVAPAAAIQACSSGSSSPAGRLSSAAGYEHVRRDSAQAGVGVVWCCRGTHPAFQPCICQGGGATVPAGQSVAWSTHRWLGVSVCGEARLHSWQRATPLHRRRSGRSARRRRMVRVSVSPTTARSPMVPNVARRTRA